MLNDKFIVAVVGESGNGKTSVVNLLQKRHRYESIDSYTTRGMRWVGEQGHTFITEQEYDEWDKDEIVGYTFFNSNHYFATKGQLRTNQLYIVDPDGVRYLKQKVANDDMKVITIHIDASEEVRTQRMYSRGDSKSAIESRINNDKEKFVKIEYDYSILNKDIDMTCDIIDQIIKTEIGSLKIFRLKLGNTRRKLFGK